MVHRQNSYHDLIFFVYNMIINKLHREWNIKLLFVWLQRSKSSTCHYYASRFFIFYQTFQCKAWIEWPYYKFPFLYTNFNFIILCFIFYYQIKVKVFVLQLFFLFLFYSYLFIFQLLFRCTKFYVVINTLFFNLNIKILFLINLFLNH